MSTTRRVLIIDRDDYKPNIVEVKKDFSKDPYVINKIRIAREMMIDVIIN